MGRAESPPATQAAAPLALLRSVVASLLVYSAKWVLSFTQRHRLLQRFRHAFHLFLRFVPSSFLQYVELVPPANAPHAPRNASGIGRALSQLLSIASDIPVSSGKYEVVRSLAERVIQENQDGVGGGGGVHALRRVNRDVLESAFARTLGRLEAAAAAADCGGSGECGVRWVMRAMGRSLGGEPADGNGVSPEKLAGELTWLAEKMAACGCGEQAVRMWAAARNLGWLALSAEPRLQASLLKLSAFLLKEAKNMEEEGIDDKEGSKTMETNMMETKLKMLESWLPLLCRASNGTNAPVLSIGEKKELEKVLEGMIEGLEKEEWQEGILSLWLHHFTHCPSSDWPNLNACYARWCSASRKQFLLK